MNASFRKVGQSFAAIASGIDLREKLGPSQVHDIEAAIAEYGVLVFKKQSLNEVQQDAFIRAFGPGRHGTFKEAAGNNPNFIDVGNVDDDGNPIPLTSARGEYMLANRLWHTDGSFNVLPIRLTALLARQLPPVPPPTEFADMRAAWNELPAEQQSALATLQVVHSITRSREQMGMTVEKFDPATLKARPPVTHPLVRTHPFNGRQSLYLASHASHVVGWPLEAGRNLIEALIAFATQPRFVYSHPWEVDDLVMWDDRWTMHRATPYDGNHPRKMRQCAVFETESV